MKIQIYLSLIIFIIIQCNNVAVVVKTKNGDLKGEYVPEQNYTHFLGIPYANPPINELRFENPIRNSWNNLLDATYFRPKCPQADHGYLPPANVSSEDCLYLNIWVPGNLEEALKNNIQFNTMVYIHGGAFIAGTGSQRVYWGDFFANSTNVIFVSLNYRLGALGFLYNPEAGIPANLGIKDQGVALDFVQDNIHFFGGNPKNVTLFGESAGAMSTQIHLVSPQTMKKKYFQKAIIQSNPAALLYRTPEESKIHTDIFSAWVECLPWDKKCFKNLKVEDIIREQERTISIPYKPSLALTELPWEPIVDGEWLTGQPLKLYQEGKYYNVPIMIGTNQNETTSFGYNLLNFFKAKGIDRYIYEGIIEIFFYGHTQEIFELYPPEDDSTKVAFRLSTDWLFVCPTRNISLSASSLKTPVYLYHFLWHSYDDPTGIHPIECQKIPNVVCHASELPFVFHTTDFYSPNFTFTKKEEILSQKMLTSWANFAKGTVPNEEWKLFKENEMNNMIFDIPDYPSQNYRKKECDFWDKLGYNY